jgi:hypothetical protein
VFGFRAADVIRNMSATNRRILVWGAGTEQTAGTKVARRGPLPRRQEGADSMRRRYSELTRLAARLVDECRRLRCDNDDLRGSAEIWIRLYERQLERANALEKTPAEEA